MNRIFKTMRSAVRNCAVVVSELASSAGVGGAHFAVLVKGTGSGAKNTGRRFSADTI